MITLLFRGLGAEVLFLIPEDMKVLYNALKRVQQTDSDSVTVYHAKEALGELKGIMTALVTSSQQQPPSWMDIRS